MAPDEIWGGIWKAWEDSDRNIINNDEKLVEM